MISPRRLAVLLAAVPAFAAVTPRSDGTAGLDIVGGSPAHAGHWPFAVSMTKSNKHWCAGILLNANTVLSAAHCFNPDDGRDKPIEAFLVRAGSSSWTSGGVQSHITQMLFYPGFDAATLDRDVILLRLSTPILESSTIQYARLPSQGYDPSPGTWITMAGWGTTSASDSELYPDQLQELTQQVVSRSNSLCTIQATGNDPVRISSGMFCAGDGTVNKNQCRGDSGGPTIVSSGIVIGLMDASGVPGNCAIAGRAGIFVNIGYFVDWINANVF